VCEAAQHTGSHNSHTHPAAPGACSIGVLMWTRETCGLCQMRQVRQGIPAHGMYVCCCLHCRCAGTTTLQLWRRACPCLS
jgi:hypothetical protein